MRILFASWHFYLDQSNGASISTRELLRALAARGWETSTFCGPIVDNPNVSSVEKVLAARKIAPLASASNYKKTAFSTVSFRDEKIKSIAFCPVDRSQVPSSDVGRAFLSTLDAVLKRVRPDVVATYGGYWLGDQILERCKRCGAKTIVLLQNFAYHDAGYFQQADIVVVPSQYAADVYRKRLDLKTVVAPPPIDWNAVAPERDLLSCKRRTEADLPASSGSANEKSADGLLFVNPSLNKGVPLFARIVKELWIQRPDIPVLVVEGSSNVDSLRDYRSILADVKSVNYMRNTTRPWDYYRQAKITLVPSYFDESFGRVAAESLIAGVPVVASNRGALPETLADAAILLDIPKEYGPESKDIPPSKVAKPWIDAIVKLWDDEAFYEDARKRGLERAETWKLERVVDVYERLFKGN
ncbi:MAG: glycosyltransferase [Thermoguttaceae bacterium]|nr:glycosyltransferase [Thermoguttaceae bacterium]MBR5757917.1 glycosyltransferase [Thermoguttaceae bacterium]